VVTSDVVVVATTVVEVVDVVELVRDAEVGNGSASPVQPATISKTAGR
jgi:hypothetical protein